MKNVTASILLVLALILTLFLYKAGQRQQDLQRQQPMTATELRKEKEKAQAEKTAEPIKEEQMPPENEETGASEETEEGEMTEQAEAGEETLPSRAQDLEELRETLSERISLAGGEWSVFIRYLPTGEDIDIDSRSMVAASLIKLYVAGAYLEAVEKGELQDIYDEFLRNMISVSDNDAANRLIVLLGMDRINAFIEEQGFEDTRLNRLMLQNNGLENYTSVKDCADFLDEVCEGTFVSPGASGRILDAMKDQKVRTKIPAGLPEDVVCANKTGELSGIENDAAVVFGQGGSYIFCVMSDHVSAGNAQKEIQEMSRLIYESLGKDKEDERPSGGPAENTGKKTGMAE